MLIDVEVEEVNLEVDQHDSQMVSQMSEDEGDESQNVGAGQFPRGAGHFAGRGGQSCFSCNFELLPVVSVRENVMINASGALVTHHCDGTTSPWRTDSLDLMQPLVTEGTSVTRCCVVTAVSNVMLGAHYFQLVLQP